ncbi:Hypothetical protein, putative [Bodo saltans]|uniref:Uncharacterized protein n=1 Tax=Bodo saltans TaxID=75058 RepID=A0A0S4JBC7_BODSA|nr:Hypothetical protein, putative [Bodo saltans]|eukprot:CUG86214.1 Hypothetical protein, putative [Bodo saltans]
MKAMARELCLDSEPFTMFAFGPSVAEKLEAWLPSVCGDCSKDRLTAASPLKPTTLSSESLLSMPTNNTMRVVPNHWSCVVESQWANWLQRYLNLRHHDGKHSPSGDTAALESLIPCLSLLHPPVSTTSRRVFSEVREAMVLSGVLNVLSYLLETAMRRVMWGVAQRRQGGSKTTASSSDHKKPVMISGGGGALHSVLLKDISRELLEAYHAFSSSSRPPPPHDDSRSEGGGDGVHVSPSSVHLLPSLLLGDCLQALHSEFVDPTLSGLNLRNLIQHGYLCPFLEETNDTVNDVTSTIPPRRSSSLLLLTVIKDRLLDHIGTIADVAVVLLREETVAVVADGRGDCSYRLLSEVRLEREPRRQEAVDAFVELLCRRGAPSSTTLTTMPAIPPPPAASEEWCHLFLPLCNDITSLLVLFPWMERSLRLVVAAASAAAARDGSNGSPVTPPPFAPQIGQPFADLEALFGLCSGAMEHQLLDIAVGGGGSGLSSSPCTSLHHWKWWEAVLVAPEGPRIRDVLVHCKWNPTSKERASVSSCKSASGACPPACGSNYNIVLAVRTFSSLLTTATLSLLEFTSSNESLKTRLLTNGRRNGPSSSLLDDICTAVGSPLHHQLTLFSLTWRRVERVRDSLLATQLNPTVAGQTCHNNNCDAWYRCTTVTEQGEEVHKLMYVGDDSAPPSPPTVLVHVSVLALRADARFESLSQQIRRGGGVTARGGGGGGEQRVTPLPSTVFGDIHIAIFAWASFVEAVDNRAGELVKRVEARKAREQQRLQLSAIYACRLLLVNTVACHLGDLMQSLNDVVVAPSRQEVRRKCRLMASLLATSNVGDLTSVVLGLERMR